MYNLQSGNLFVDLRIPRTKPKSFARKRHLSELTDDELRNFARQHIFAGFTLLSNAKTKCGIINSGMEELPIRPVCTRHHCVDWNFVGHPRSRPNKWYVELSKSKDRFKEWAYATDSFAQHYYVEVWKRWHGDDFGDGLRLSLRKSSGCDRDGILVVVGVRHCVLCIRVCGK
ncbi:MAG: hypothetical protein ACREBR_00850 [bacterium]